MIHPVTWANQKLAGWPEQWLTALLFVLAGLALYVALRGSPATKALLAAWFIVP